jgi:hypothetical protein
MCSEDASLQGGAAVTQIVVPNILKDHVQPSAGSSSNFIPMLNPENEETKTLQNISNYSLSNTT